MVWGSMYIFGCLGLGVCSLIGAVQTSNDPFKSEILQLTFKQTFDFAAHKTSIETFGRLSIAVKYE